MSEDEIESRHQRIRMVIENQAVAKQNAMVMIPYHQLCRGHIHPRVVLDNNVNAGSLRLGVLEIDLEKINNK